MSRIICDECNKNYRDIIERAITDEINDVWQRANALLSRDSNDKLDFLGSDVNVNYLKMIAVSKIIYAFSIEDAI